MYNAMIILSIATFLVVSIYSVLIDSEVKKTGKWICVVISIFMFYLFANITQGYSNLFLTYILRVLFFIISLGWGLSTFGIVTQQFKLPLSLVGVYLISTISLFFLYYHIWFVM